MKQHIPEFLQYCKAECGFSKHTINAYRVDLNEFFSCWNSSDFSHTIASYLDMLHCKKRAEKTIARKLSALKSFIRFSAHEGFCDESLLYDIPDYDTPLRLPKGIQLSVINTLLNCPDRKTKKGLRDYTIMVCLYSTGMRVSECLHLRPSDIQLQEGVVSVTGKGNKQRIIPLTSLAVNALEHYMATNQPLKEYVFSGNTDEPLTRHTVYARIKFYVNQCEFPDHDISPHRLRHAFATHLIEGGARLRDVQILLGHQQLASTQVYTKVSQPFVKQTYLQAHPRATQ